MGCGRKSPQADLLRLVGVEGVLTVGRGLPGRGVYTCRSLECFERALARRAFTRGLRTSVDAGPELRRLYTGESHG